MKDKDHESPAIANDPDMQELKRLLRKQIEEGGRLPDLENLDRHTTERLHDDDDQESEE